jgi:hypothetical protein
MKHPYVTCHGCGTFLQDHELRETPEFYNNPESTVHCDECKRIRVPENILSDEELKALRVERQKIIWKKHIGEGIANQEQDHLDGLTKKLRLHWRATAKRIEAVRHSPYWEDCDFCDAPMKSEEEYRAHWNLCPIRKLDNEIAEKAMGWKLDEDGLGNRYWCGSFHDRNGMSEHQAQNSFEPARNMQHAYWVMKNLEKEGWEFDIDIKDGRSCVWAYNSKTDRIGASELEADKLPEAICRAILKIIPGSPNR